MAPNFHRSCSFGGDRVGRRSAPAGTQYGRQKLCALAGRRGRARLAERFSKRTISRSGHQSSDYSAVAASERPAHRTRFGARPVPIWLTIESPRGLIDLFLISSISRPAGVHHLLPLRVPCSVLTDRVHRHCLGPVMNKSLSDSASNWVLLPTSVWNGMVGSYQATRDCMVTRQSSQLSLSRCRSARRNSQIATTHSFPETVAAPATFSAKVTSSSRSDMRAVTGHCTRHDKAHGWTM